eukprot:PhM_4_TR11173/c0_g1_i1/m.54003
MPQVFLEKSPDVPDNQLDELEDLIRKKFAVSTGFGEPHQLSAALQKTFQSFDTLEGDMLSEKEFYGTLNKINCAGRRDIVSKLFLRYDLKAKGVISVKTFCDGLFGLQPVAASDPDARSLISQVRQLIKQRNNGITTFRGLTRILRIMDDNGNRRLEPEELRTGLADYGLRLTKPELALLFKYFDRDKSGSIDVTEFIVGIRGQMSPQRRELVRQAFLKLEKTGDGRVTMDDLAITYNASENPLVKEGKMTEREVLQEFSSMWNKNGDDEITLDEFVDYYNDISASIDNDQYFELMIRNAWHISGGTGAAACTTTRRVLVHHLDGTSTVEEVEDDLGLDFDDKQAVMERLRKQGVSDILKVEVN